MFKIFLILFSLNSFCLDTDVREQDEYANRPDVAGFKEEPVVFFLPFWKEIKAVHPKSENDDSDNNVVVIDLDELAATGSSSHGGEGAEIGETILLAGSGVLAFWFGTRTSIIVILETTKEIKELSAEKKALILAKADASLRNISSEEKRRFHENFKALLEENKQNRLHAKFERVFMGVVPAIGATATGVSAFLQIPFYATASMAAAGALGMAISGPIISLFSVAAGAKHGYNFYKTFPTMEEVTTLLAKDLDPNERRALELLKERLDLTRILTSTSATSMLAMAVGVPLTIFGGPFDLGVMLPGAVGGIAGSYFHNRKLNYSPQLSWEQKSQIDGRVGLVNEINAAHAEYSLLKRMKSEQRLLYPIGKNSPWPCKSIANSIAKLKRMTTKEDLTYLSAEQTFFAYLKEHNTLDIVAKLITLTGLDEKYARFSKKHRDRTGMTPDDILIEQEILTKISEHSKDLEDLRLEEKLLIRTLENPLSDDESVFLLLRYMVKSNLFLPFAEGILNKKSLKKMIKYTGALTKDGDEFHINANKLVTLMMDDSVISETDRIKLRAKLFKLGRDILFITAKNRIQWKERQLLDFLAIHLNSVKG